MTLKKHVLSEAYLDLKELLYKLELLNNELNICIDFSKNESEMIPFKKLRENYFRSDSKFINFKEIEKSLNNIDLVIKDL